MNNYPEILGNLIKRALIAVPLIAAGLFLFAGASGGMLTAAATVMVGAVAIILGAIVIAFPLARLLAESSGQLFWPSRHDKRPQPMYGIPESKRARGAYEEAMAGFEEIAAAYPDELKPYVEMIDIAIRDLRDPARANEIYRRGIERLKKDDDREALARMYSAIRTRLEQEEEGKTPGGSISGTPTAF